MKWWLGEPIWDTVANQGLKAATYFWPGSEVKKGSWAGHWRKTLQVFSVMEKDKISPNLLVCNITIYVLVKSNNLVNHKFVVHEVHLGYFNGGVGYGQTMVEA
ncbi:unnamed protein product [Lactuca virosa]|uniref:Uncharacterized protein n=1 Tax=Lactuca virosa TaxID=75947 RepID=A0AAU9LGG0_9ASTR|nr:unnamed protein product [Lactuca virosa]